MTKQLLRFTNHLGKPAAVRADQVDGIEIVSMTPDRYTYDKVQYSQITLRSGAKFKALHLPDELIQQLSEILER